MMSQLDIRNVDCMELMAEFSDSHFDLAVVDPPYFDGPNKLGFYGSRRSRTGVYGNGYKKIGVWKVPGREYFAELKRVSKQQIIWGYNYYPIQNLGGGRIVWDKINSASTYSDCEIAYCSSIESVRIFRYMWNGMLQGSLSDGTVAQGNKELNEKRIHPTQKPVQLYNWVFSKFAEKGMRILDTHLGSGSSAIAAYYLGLNFTGAELDSEYYEASLDRIARETSQGVLAV